MRTQCDVLVVGAGPAGTTCAETVARSGASVVVLDKKSAGWHKPCGGGIPETAFAKFDLPLSLGFATPAVRVFDRKGEETRTTFPYRDVYRNVFDEHLAERARQAGAEVVFNASVQEIERTAIGFRATTAHGSCEAKYLVAADGCMSMVRRRLFPEELREEMLAVAVEYWYRIPHGVTSLDFFVEPQLLDTGYAYVFPKGPDLLVIGIAGVGIDKPRLVLDKLLTQPRYRSLVGEAPIEAVHGARIPYRHLSRFRDGRLLLVGDAAGLNTPIIFAGIPVALQSGRLAGRLLAKALSTGSDAPLDGFTPDAMRRLSSGFTACHAYYDYLVEHRRTPSFGFLARRLLSRPHKLPQTYVLWRSLNRLVEGLNLDRIAGAASSSGKPTLAAG
jgi:geranylgeranyl reductase family protein